MYRALTDASDRERWRWQGLCLFGMLNRTGQSAVGNAPTRKAGLKSFVLTSSPRFTMHAYHAKHIWRTLDDVRGGHAAAWRDHEDYPAQHGCAADDDQSAEFLSFGNLPMPIASTPQAITRSINARRQKRLRR